MDDSSAPLESPASSPPIPVKRREVFGWCCFDFANSAFTTIVITVVGLPYFKVVVAEGNPAAEGWWGTMLALSQVGVLLLAPLIGVVADVHASKKRYLAISALICSVATVLLFGVGAGQVWLMLGLVLVANFAFSTSENICSAFLPEISTPANAGRISGYGWSFGYLGGLLSLVIALVIISSGDGRAHWSFAATGLFFFLASLPTLLLLKERATPRPLAPGQRYLRVAWQQFADMKRELPQHRMLVAGAFGFGFLQDRTGPKLPLAAALVIWIVACLWASRCETVREFYLIGVLAGIGMGSLQSASRAVVSTLTPAGRSGEFFGYWGFFAKLAAVIGTFVFGNLVSLTDYRIAIAANTGFFVIGLLILLPLKLRSSVKDT
ncbi:MAG: MFS transporter [Verrucomicrobiia bacterium]